MDHIKLSMMKWMSYIIAILLLCSFTVADLNDEFTNYYGMEESCDDSQGSDDFVLTGLTNISGIHNSAFLNNNDNNKNCINTNNFLSARQEVTVCLWINITTRSQGDTFFAVSESGGADFLVDISNAGTEFRVYNGNGKATGGMSFPSSEFTTGVWHLICYVGNTSGTRIYMNSTLKYSDAESGVMPTSSKDIMMYAQESGDGGIDGIIDEVMIWNRSLSAAEIGELYAETFPPFPSDNSPPTYTNFANNATEPTFTTDDVNCNVTLADETGLSTYIVEHNGSGVFANTSSFDISGTSINVNFTFSPSVEGTDVGCKFYFNDTSDNKNETNLSVFFVNGSISYPWWVWEDPETGDVSWLVHNDGVFHTNKTMFALDFIQNTKPLRASEKQAYDLLLQADMTTEELIHSTMPTECMQGGGLLLGCQIHYLIKAVQHISTRLDQLYAIVADLHNIRKKAADMDFKIQRLESTNLKLLEEVKELNYVTNITERNETSINSSK